MSEREANEATLGGRALTVEDLHQEIARQRTFLEHERHRKEQLMVQLESESDYASSLRRDLDRLLASYEKLTELHAHVQMDTDRDRDLHAEAVDLCRKTAAHYRARLGLEADAPSEPPVELERGADAPTELGSPVQRGLDQGGTDGR